MTTFAFAPQGFVFEILCDLIIVYPVTEEATLWLNLIEEARWPGVDFVWVNGGRAVVRGEQWCELFMEIYHAGWSWSFEWCEPVRAGRIEARISRFRKKPPAAS